MTPNTTIFHHSLHAILKNKSESEISLAFNPSNLVDFMCENRENWRRIQRFSTMNTDIVVLYSYFTLRIRFGSFEGCYKYSFFPL